MTGGAEAFTRDAAVSYLQGLAVSEVKELANRLGEGTPEAEAARAALHGIVGCAGAAASAQTCNAGAMGAAASSVLGSLLGPTTGLSAQEKEAQTNLVTSFVAGVAGGMGDPVTAANAAGTEGLYNRQLHQHEYDDARRHAKTVAKELGISEQEAEGRIIAEMLSNSDKRTAEATDGKHDYEIRRIIGCQNLNCDGYKSDPNYGDHAYNSEYVEPNRSSYELGQQQLGRGQTYNELVTSNIQKDPVGSTLAGVGMMGLGLATGGPLATMGMMGIGTTVGLGVNGGLQLISDKPFDCTSFGTAGITGALSTGMRFAPVLLTNVGGALTSSALRGENPNGAMAGATAGTVIGYPVGAKVESGLGNVINPWYRQEWRYVGMGISTYVPKSTIPSWFGGAGNGVIQGITDSAVQTKVEP